MEQGNLDYFVARADEEDRLAARSMHRGVRAKHQNFAAVYRAYAGKRIDEIVPPDFLIITDDPS